MTTQGSLHIFQIMIHENYYHIEGFHAKRAYIAFWVDFYFLQDRANFWQTDLF